MTSKKASKFTVKKVILIILVVLLAFASVSAGIMFGKLNYMTSLGSELGDIFDEPPMRGKVNLLLLGVDGDGFRADTIMIVSVDNVNNSIKLLSIPRDTKITLNNGKTIKINSCMGFEKREKFMIETVKTVTKMPIHYYCEVDFDGFIEIIDILDGVDYDVPFDMDYDDPEQDLHIHLKAGMQHLDGKAAHDFVRFRHNNKGAEVYAPGEYAKGDIGRIGAQQAFLSELFRQKMQTQYLLKAPELIDAAHKYVKTNFSVTKALEFLSIVKSTNTTEIEAFLLPGTDRYEGKVSYYIYSPSETKELVLNEFGYANGKEATATQKPSSVPKATSTPVAEETRVPEALID